MANNDIVPGFYDEKDESLKLRIEKANQLPRCIVLSISGYIDTYNSNFFLERVQKVIDNGFTKLIFLCSGLNYVSSTGIGSFTTFLKTVKPQGGDIILVDIQPKVFEVLQLLGFSQFFNITDSVDDAIQFFSIDHRTDENESVFPKVISCPICYKKLKAMKPGRFRCSECKSVLSIDDSGQVLLG